MRQKTLNTFGVSTRKKGIILFLITSCVFISLITYSKSDNCLNVVSNVATKNFLGSFGAIISDICYQYFGISIFCFFPFTFYLSYQYIFRKRPKVVALKIIYTIIATLCFNFILSCITSYQNAFTISLSGRIGVLLSKNCPLFVKFIIVITSLIILSLYPYIMFYNRNNIEINAITKKRKKNNMVYLILYKILSNINKIVKTVTFIVLIFAKLVAKILTVFKRRKDGKNKRSQKQLKHEQNIELNNKQQYNTIEEKNIYNRPKIDLLKNIENQNDLQNQTILKSNLEKLSKILGDFGIRGEMMGYRTGPIVTLYEFKPQAGVKASRVIGLSDDIARTMMVGSVRTAAISGRDTLGIEVPNKDRECVCFRKLVESQEYQISNAKIPMILGCNIFGKPIVADLTDMPHLLIAGTTGSGKSVGINGMILSMLYKLSPEECKLIMIDPKMLEFSAYEGIPHLMLPVITDAKHAVLSLKWVVREMEKRYKIMSEAGVRNIMGYNQKIKLLKKKSYSENNETFENLQPMHYIVVIIDEMADLMVVAGKEIEILVQRLSQMARAAGIHLIMATQRPSVDVITGVIKSNFPTRISYRVTSKIDSRTILGEQGAEQLLGKGDMLFMFGGTKTLRVHGPMITDEEVENVVHYLKDNNDKPEYITLTSDENLVDNLNGEEMNEFGNENDNILYRQAVRIVMSEKKTSISYIQRKLRIGYNKAANFIEKMEEDGILSSPDQSGKRILIKENNN